MLSNWNLRKCTHLKDIISNEILISGFFLLDFSDESDLESKSLSRNPRIDENNCMMHDVLSIRDST